MKHASLIVTSLLIAAACGGKAKPATPSNTGVASATPSTDCKTGFTRVSGECEKICETDDDCYEQAPQCIEVAGANERDTTADGRIGAVMEPLRACGIDH